MIPSIKQNEGDLGIESNRSVELSINNVGIPETCKLITFIVLSFDIGRLGKQKNERETHINWHALHDMVIMGFQPE